MSASGRSAARITAPDDAYAFGKNWQRYIANHLDPERRRIARESVAEFLDEDLAGKLFLDIGSGSGLFSLAAYELGAERVISVDVDADSVAATRELRERADAPENWEVREGSILDSQVVTELEQADVVYSWGVLHHTGDMDLAIRNAASLVKPGGLFAIAIYNRVTGRFLDSQRWWKIKRRYNHSPEVVRWAMRVWIRMLWVAQMLKRGKNPWTAAREYTERGMAATTDLFDWVGGFPYEYATVDEIVAFCRAECEMEELKTVQLPPRDIGLNRFLFRRRTG